MSTATMTTDAPLTTSALEDAARIPGFGVDVAATLEWCVAVGGRAPRVGEGSTRDVWNLLAAVAEVDVSAARMLEPHLDALSILHQAGMGICTGAGPSPLDRVGAGPTSSWGVFAAEAPGTTLEAIRDDKGGRLRGTKPWCSLAGQLTHALVTASVDDHTRGLFAVDLRADGVRAHVGPWFARGLRDVVSTPVEFDAVPAVPVGDAGWYTRRPGFAWGGMSVAACWWGAAVGVAAPLLTAARSERADQLSLVHLGATDAALWAARAVLDQAADAIDSGESAAIGERLLAERVRSVVAAAAERTLAETDAALGPAPLVSDDDHARRVADLHLYLRQHHGPRDTARIGRELAARA